MINRLSNGSHKRVLMHVLYGTVVRVSPLQRLIYCLLSIEHSGCSSPLVFVGTNFRLMFYPIEIQRHIPSFTLLFQLRLVWNVLKMNYNVTAGWFFNILLSHHNVLLGLVGSVVCIVAVILALSLNFWRIGSSISEKANDRGNFQESEAEIRSTLL